MIFISNTRSETLQRVFGFAGSCRIWPISTNRYSGYKLHHSS